METPDELIDATLRARGYEILSLDEREMTKRLDEVMAFVNQVRSEYEGFYGWTPESRAYFLEPMKGKWHFSFAIQESASFKIVFVGISSVYVDRLHIHAAFAASEVRGQRLGTLHNLKLCSLGIRSGLTRIEAHTHRLNSRAIIFYLRLGWQIEDVVKGRTQLLLSADMRHSMELSIRQLVSENRSSNTSGNYNL